MKKRLGCLHAHYSNIDYIEKGLSRFDIELLHFVDPGLIDRVTSDENFNVFDAQTKVKEQIKWIAGCNVDAILITCTNYIAILQNDQHQITVPIIKIDEPFFESICNTQKPQTIVFTNPATVEGTMNRLKQYAKNQQKSLDVEAIVIKNTFELIMKGRKEEYCHEISKFLYQIMHEEEKVISVAQLSMVEASQLVENQTSNKIINPLDSLITFIANRFL